MSSSSSSSPNTTAPRIAIVGAGEVGSTIAFSLICTHLPCDIIIVDPQEEFRDAQVQDLSDATFHGDTTTRVRKGDHKEAGQCDIVVVTAGAKQKEGESRTDLIGRNLSILSSVINDMKPFSPSTVLLLVSNPVDILTYFAQKFSGLPRSQVIGSGTFLDTARLRGILAEKCDIAAGSVDAYVLGEHGESQFVAWSCATVSGIPLANVIPEAKLDTEAVAKDTKDKATAIMENKGATAFGIAGVVASLCKSILSDEHVLRPLSHYQEGLGVCLSLPAVLGKKGILRTVEMPMSEGEKKALEKSAKSLKDIIENAEKEEEKEKK